MFYKTIMLCVALVGAALAAPTTPNGAGLEKRADWQANKCEAHIYLDKSDPTWTIGPKMTWKWDVNIIDTAGTNIAHWDMTNPPEPTTIDTTKEYDFVIEGLGNPDWNAHGALTLKYDTQAWNSVDCYRYIYKAAGPSNGQRYQYDWWCQFDC